MTAAPDAERLAAARMQVAQLHNALIECRNYIYLREPARVAKGEIEVVKRADAVLSEIGIIEPAFDPGGGGADV